MHAVHRRRAPRTCAMARLLRALCAFKNSSWSSNWMATSLFSFNLSRSLSPRMPPPAPAPAPAPPPAPVPLPPLPAPATEPKPRPRAPGPLAEALSGALAAVDAGEISMCLHTRGSKGTRGLSCLARHAGGVPQLAAVDEGAVSMCLHIVLRALNLSSPGSQGFRD